MFDSSYRELGLFIDKNDLINGIYKVIKLLKPDWVFNNMKFQIFSEGRTNQLVGVYYDHDKKDTVLVRVNGENTEKIIDRKNEIKIMQFFHSIGLSSKVYASFSNGLAYNYLPGKILNEETCCDNKIFPLVAEKMAKYHLQLSSYQQLFEDGEIQYLLWDKIKLFLASYNDEVCEKGQQSSHQQRCGLPCRLPSKKNLTKEFEWLVEHLDKLKNPIVFCHNDLLLANILYDEETHQVHFIDFEYAGPNYQAYDIANHFSEFSGTHPGGRWLYYPDESFRRKWIEAYLKTYYNCNYVDEFKLTKLLEEVEHFRLASHFFCGTWGLYQMSNSTLEVDFIEYSVQRLDEYFRVKKLLITPSCAP